MKRLWLLAVFAVLFTIYSCEIETTSSSDDIDRPEWDLLLLAQSETCSNGFVERGYDPLSPLAALLEGIDIPYSAGFFPGLKVVQSSYEFDADIPQMTIYTVLLDQPGSPAPSKVLPGDSVFISFTYNVINADGKDGDFFIVRITDGGRFVVPVKLRSGDLSEAGEKTVNYKYTAKSHGFAMNFITGLSSGDEEISVSVNSIRVAGSEIASGNLLCGPTMSDEECGFTATGDSYFQFYGQGAEFNGVEALIATYSNADIYVPFYGQSMAAKINNAYFGDYYANNNFNDIPEPDQCSESGNLLIAVNPKGNAEISGWWDLSIQASCSEIVPGEVAPSAAVGYVETAFTTPVYVSFMPHVVNIFTSMDNPVDVFGNVYGSIVAFTIGDSATVLLFTNDTQTVLAGVYDASQGGLVGQVEGTIKEAGGGICVIEEGQFFIPIDKTTPPPSIPVEFE